MVSPEKVISILRGMTPRHQFLRNTGYFFKDFVDYGKLGYAISAKKSTKYHRIQLKTCLMIIQMGQIVFAEDVRLLAQVLGQIIAFDAIVESLV